MAERELTQEERWQRLIWGALSTLVALGLAASAALLVDYLRPLPLFCSDTGGCGELRRSAFSHFFGLPTPLYGVAGYAMLGLLTALRGDVARFLELIAAMFGALVAAYLLFIQFSLGTFCTYCMIVDVTTILLLSAVLMRVRIEADPPSWKASVGAGAAFAVAVAIPFGWNALEPKKVPDLVAQEMKKTPRGEITIIDFVDFECPFCRQTAEDFEPLLEKYKGKYRFVRKEMPLAKIHPHALVAAKAECCAESMGQGDAMATKLASAPVADLTEDGCATLAVELGIDEQAFRACLSDPKTMQRVESDGNDFHAVNGHSLPLIWINDQMIEGAQGPDRLREAMDKALAEAGG
jgi:uncharacterized membrane protein/protein-disulfide isomerase